MRWCIFFPCQEHWESRVCGQLPAGQHHLYETACLRYGLLVQGAAQGAVPATWGKANSCCEILSVEGSSGGQPGSLLRSSTGTSSMKMTLTLMNKKHHTIGFILCVSAGLLWSSWSPIGAPEPVLKLPQLRPKGEVSICCKDHCSTLLLLVFVSF